MAKANIGDPASMDELLAGLGRIDIEAPLVQVKEVYEPRAYERAGKLGELTQTFVVRGEAGKSSFSLRCELRGEEQIAYAGAVVIKDRYVSVRGVLSIYRRPSESGPGSDSVKLLVKQVSSAW